MPLETINMFKKLEMEGGLLQNYIQLYKIVGKSEARVRCKGSEYTPVLHTTQRD